MHTNYIDAANLIAGLQAQLVAVYPWRIASVFLQEAGITIPITGGAMRMSDEEYFRSCIAQERHLAQLRGHHNIEEFYESAGSLWENTQVLPKWTRDWQACGPLIAEYALAVTFQDLADDAHGKAIHIGTTVVHISDHPNQDQAMRYAIVKAAIAHLEHAKHCKH